MPRVSVICVGLRPEEFEPVRLRLARQSFRDFEFVGEVGGTIPEAWNRAIGRASGEILVFSETDAEPVNEHWLEELVDSVPDDRTVVRGLEINSFPWNMSNLAVHRNLLAGTRFDERFRWAEDTELFCRLKQQGYQLRQVSAAPVVHPRNPASRRRMQRAFRYGLYWARLRYWYDDPVELYSVSHASKVVLRALLNLLGLLVGYIVYLPERRRRR